MQQHHRKNPNASKNRRKPPRSDEELRRCFVAAADNLGQEAPFLLQHVGPHEFHVISDAEFLRMLEEVSPASRTDRGWDFNFVQEVVTAVRLS